MVSDENRREIRSFVVRGGRLTPSQQFAMDALWPRYGLSRQDGVLDREVQFGRVAPLVLEIGFGMGDSLVAMAKRDQHLDHVGIDVHPPGIGTILKGIEDAGLGNLKVYQDDAVQVLRACVADESLHKVQIFFPDPWHKKRHHKRRLIQPDFVQELRHKLEPGGILHIATDWQNYAEHISEVMEAAEGFANLHGPGALATDHGRVETKFERRGLRLGHGVWDMCYRRTG